MTCSFFFLDQYKVWSSVQDRGICFYLIVPVNEIQTDHLFLARRPDQVIVNKKKRTCRIVDFAGWSRGKTEKKSEKRDKYQELARELKKTTDHESGGDTNCNWRGRYNHQRILTGTGGFWNKRISGDYQNFSIVESGQNTEKSPGDLRRLQWKTIS